MINTEQQQQQSSFGSFEKNNIKIHLSTKPHYIFSQINWWGYFNDLIYELNVQYLPSKSSGAEV